MRILFACVLLVACETESNVPTPDLAVSEDLLVLAFDLAVADLESVADLAMSIPDGGWQFGHSCNADSECATGTCFMGAMHFCTMPCTPATQATDCPSPPTSGMCNLKGYCKP
jgi:hypothetical protein